MKKGFLTHLCLIFGLPFTALADPVAVQSGEHANFTRLVTPLTGVADWSVTQSDRQIVVSFEDFEDGFDIGQVFDRIPRDRIAQMDADADSLTLTLACDCFASTFLAAGPYLVVDIAEQGVALTGTTVPVVSPAEDVQTTENEVQPNPLQTPLPRPQSVPPALPPLLLTSPTGNNPLNTPQPALDRATLRNNERQVLAEMQEKLVRELGSAASRGVLTPAPDRHLPAIPQLMETENTPVATPEIVAPQLGPLANIRISSSLDRPNSGQRTTLGVNGVSCPPEGALDLLAWGTEESFATQMAAARDGLYGELDRLDSKAAKRLAQLYLYFGFGAEARQILELDPKLLEENDHLLMVADIFDGLDPSTPTALSRALDCEPEVVLWATLVQPEPVQGAKPNSDAALRALSKLPFHLRQILAPELSRKLLAYGDNNSAAQALRSLERTPAPLHSAAKLAQAELQLHNGDAKEGTEQLEEIATDNTAQSPAALIALVDAKIAAKQPIDLDAAELIEAYAQELRDTELGPALRRAHILALLKSGQFDAAFAAKTALGGDANTASAKSLRADLIRDLATTADDIVFLEHIFAQDEADIRSLPRADMSTLAARFLATGFAERAERTLGYVPLQSMSTDQKLLAAEIALALEKPNQAQAKLLGLESEAANRLRADAKRMAGAFDEAHALYAESDLAQPAAEAAWMSEDWQGLTTAETPLFGPATQLAGFSNDVTDDPTGMLARSAAALEESEAARQTLAELLGAAELQVEAQN